MSDNSTALNATALEQLEISLGDGCQALIPGVPTSYGYVPNLIAGIVFCAAFGIAVLGHLIRAIQFRRSTSLLLAIGALTEAIGWAGRTWSSECPYNNDAFLMQITTLIVAPTFFTAALYVLLGTLIRRLGPRSTFRLLSPRWYTAVFCTCDAVSLVVQAVGGALASMAADEVGGDTTTGTNIMVVGICFQMGSMTLFALLFADFVRRALRRPLAPLEHAVGLVVFAMVISCVCIYVRSVYRTIELLQGWTGYLITHEGFFLGLDASIMVVAVGVFLIIDPAVLLKDKVISGKYMAAAASDEEVVKLEPVGPAEEYESLRV